MRSLCTRGVSLLIMATVLVLPGSLAGLEAPPAPAPAPAPAASASAPGAELIDTNAATIDAAPTVRENQPFRTTITVVNPYDRAVRVRLLDASCTCATLELKDSFLLPHAKTTLQVVVNNAERSGEQDVHVSIFVTDPDFEPIEVTVLWHVLACIEVDSIPPGADSLKRPEDRGWQDVYRYVIDERPDEPQRLRKNIRLESPPGEVPTGGLKIEKIEYTGTVWAFTPVEQANGSWLIRARAPQGVTRMTEGEYHETVLVHTNHPDKPVVTLHFESRIGPAHAAADPGHP